MITIISVILAIMFLLAGGMKIMQPKEKLAEKMAWAEDFSASQVRNIGIVEVLGGLGLILPWTLDILAWLTPLAALGLAITMLGAAYTHFKRNEMTMIGIPVVLFLLSIFVAWSRYSFLAG